MFTSEISQASVLNKECSGGEWPAVDEVKPGITWDNLIILFYLLSCSWGGAFGKAILCHLWNVKEAGGDLQPLQEGKCCMHFLELQKEQMQKLQTGLSFTLVPGKIMEWVPWEHISPEEGESDWKQSTGIFLTFNLTSPGDKMTGSVDTNDIYLDCSEVLVSKLGYPSLDVRKTSKQPVGWLGSEGHG